VTGVQSGVGKPYKKGQERIVVLALLLSCPLYVLGSKRPPPNGYKITKKSTGKSEVFT
jgi:hypothetical protein